MHDRQKYIRIGSEMSGICRSTHGVPEGSKLGPVCIDALFSDEELANSNTSGSNGYRELDNLKLRFLLSVPCQKYESPMFMRQWEDVKSKINTLCRGKRRTVQHRLHKQVNF